MNTPTTSTRNESADHSNCIASRSPVSWGEALRTWAFIGLHSFGGPAGQIAVMHQVLVEQKRWISEARFLHALNYCMLLPGPEAMQLATYVGWLMHRTWGGLLAGTLFVLPGFVSILALSMAYTMFRDVGFVQAMLFGLQAAVLVIVVEALLRITRRALKNAAMYMIAGASFLAIFVFAVPFPIIIAFAATVGWIGARLLPKHFAPTVETKSDDDDRGYLTDDLDAAHTQPSVMRSLRTLTIWLTLWFAPVVAIGVMLGWDDIFTTEALFFSKTAVVTFGGAYAVLAYIAQQAVEHYHWLEPGEMVTGLGMAETTPGPLIQVVQFVGYMGAFRHAVGTDGSTMHPLLAGTLASVLVTWVTFVPCFLWIFLGAPYMEALRSNRMLGAALKAITAAVVGVILNLAIWFALHTLFAEVNDVRWMGARLLVPDFASIDVAALVIAIFSGVVLLRFHWGIMRTLGAAVALSVLWFLLMP